MTRHAVAVVVDVCLGQYFLLGTSVLGTVKVLHEIVLYNSLLTLALYCFVSSLVTGLQQSFSTPVNCLNDLQRKMASVLNCFILSISPYGQRR